MSSYFRKYKSPSKIYESMWSDIDFRPILDRMSAENIILFSFLIPIKLKGLNIDELYDKIENDMFSVKLVEIYNEEPKIDCPKCHNGLNNCDFCDGIGTIGCEDCVEFGDEDCDMCNGTGLDNDNDECPHCDGTGKVNCKKCRGRGTVMCKKCDGDGEVLCDTCNGNGTIVTTEKSEVIIYEYVSYNVRWKEYFFDKNLDQEIDYEDSSNFNNSNQTIVLGIYEQITDKFTGYENDEIILLDVKNTNELNFKLSSNSIEI